MIELWFVILGLMLCAYVVLDGFDFGAGILHLFVAKTDAERRTVLAAIGPFWDGNEVWLIAAGGVPIDASRSFTMPFFTHFRATGQVGRLDYYTLSVGLLAVTLLAAHGAAFLAWRTAGAVRERCLLLERKVWPAVAALFVVVTAE